MESCESCVRIEKFNSKMNLFILAIDLFTQKNNFYRDF